MSYVIPEVPRSVATQLQRERLLAQEAKYEKGVRGREDEEELLSVLREAGLGGSRATGPRASWARRFSKLSDGLDAHVEVPPPRHQHHNLNNKPADGSTVWEVT
jgi:anoctamin-4